MKLRKQVRVLGCKETYYKIENNCRIMICLLEDCLSKKYFDKLWYFVISHNSRIFSYNSNLDQIMFKSKEECLLAAENKLNEFIQADFSKKLANVYTAIYK